ncbi:hypothetical protein IC762_24625 [Bradyrhizobium genosp. L]|uniref:hypothetical protein n=1 Tax=Bradyrhizobium genosp. L TaxID=83637 RepID=UPI0018A261F8|nr:hypothetical protein [Bradyrhizobium genosp. L]QPF82912.1 hypothetical protein IC762_24625 [Bradyrhizobium genosp. L]
MTKLTFMAAALVAAAAYSAQALAAGNNAAVRRAHAQATTASAGKTNCVRAPNVGSFATAPFTEPPCMPGTMR